MAGLEAIVAVYGDWGIGADGTQPVTVSADRKHFRDLTMGAAVIVGRRTLADFPGGRPLKGRTNIVLSRTAEPVEGAVMARSAAEALEKAGSVEKVAGKWFQVSFGYEAMNSVMKILKDMDLRQQGQNFGSECSLRTWVRLSAENDFRSRMEKVENCHINEL